MSGFLPPISSWTLAPRSMQVMPILRPVPVEPVNVKARTFLDFAKTSPTFEPGPMTRLNTPEGSAPARTIISASAHALPGTRSAGLKTTALPNANAGAIFQAGIAIGKFQGVMIPTTPSGSRRTSVSTPGRMDARRSPERRNASPAKNLNTLPARTTSPIPSGRVFPSSRASNRPNSSRRAKISVPMWSSASLRTSAVDRAQFGAASKASSTAIAA
ncbi:hypothetical protein D3C81_1579980 [compost metagenome]